MKTIMVRYETAPQHAQENEALVRAVFEELRASAPRGIRYACWRLPDGVTFMHVATLESSEVNPLGRVAAFEAFRKELSSRCVAPPVVADLTPVGSYGSEG